jgi:hypothetical protein
MENYNNSIITQTLNLSDAEHTKQQSIGGIKGRYKKGGLWIV